MIRSVVILGLVMSASLAAAEEGSEVAPAPAGKAAKEKKICRTEAPSTSSRMRKPVCRTAQEWEDARQQGAEQSDLKRLGRN